MVKEELLSRFDILRIEYINLINDKDVLIKWGKPQLEALYSVKIGVFQVERLKIQLHIKALKRKLEMVRSAAARNLPIDINAIELIVAEELAEAECKIMLEATQIENSKFLLSNLHTPQKSAELRKIFKQLAKQLHPDVNPALSEVQKNLWHIVKNAYEHGDADQLKALQIVYEKELLNAENLLSQLTDEDISLRMEVLSEGIKLLMKEIESIRSSFPFSMEAQIKDEIWVKSEVEKIEKDVKQLRAYEGDLILEYESLINNYGGTRPELN